MRLICLIEKEFKQMMRNIILPVVFVLLPVALMNLVPRVATQEVKNLRISVVDNDRSPASRRIVERLAASTYFTLNDYSSSYREAEQYLKSGESDFIVEIAPHYERDMVRDEGGNIMISANAVNGVKAGLGQVYLQQIISSSLNTEHLTLNTEHSTPNTRFLFNPHLDYKLYMVPAIISLLLILTVGFLPALNIVGEKEKGTIEQINVTPIGRFEFIFSKMIPYWCVGIIMLFLAMGAAKGIHGIAPAGGIPAILAVTSLFILVVSCLGFIVSNYSDTIQQAALVMFFFLVIFLLLSGLLTPVTSMPQWAQTITEFNPMRYYIEPMRMIYIKSSNLSELMPYLRRLTLMAAVLWAWAIISYRKSQ
ncbi:MAG: ABC transporter permease [Prevotella sp.]|nr:ABC transporter permease [Prevotella sp.]